MTNSSKKENKMYKIIIIVLLLLLIAFAVGLLQTRHTQSKLGLTKVSLVNDSDIPTEQEELGVNNIQLAVSNDITITNKKDVYTLKNLEDNTGKYYLRFLLVDDANDKTVFKMKEDEFVAPGDQIKIPLGKLLSSGKHIIRVYQIPYRILEDGSAAMDIEDETDATYQLLTANVKF